MNYHISMLTFSSKIPTGTTSELLRSSPWSNSTAPFTITGVENVQVAISDDDERFQSGYYSPSEQGQTLVNDLLLKDQTIPAGTQMTHYIGSIIRSTSPNEFGTYDEYLVTFPRKFESGKLGTEVGDKYSVFVFPQQRADGSYPQFDTSGTYKWAKTQTIGTAKDWVEYPKVACFAMGSMIETDTGPTPIELLRTEDMVLTRDNGYRPIRWIGSSVIDANTLDLQPNLRPILIAKDALGANLPDQDLTVSPQHRMLVQSKIGKRLYDHSELLVAAKHLIGLEGISVFCPEQGVSYFHILFDQHEIVLSNGTWSESLFPGPQALRAISPEARREIFARFPELANPDNRPNGARRFLNGREAREFVGRHHKHHGRRQLFEPV